MTTQNFILTREDDRTRDFFRGNSIKDLYYIFSDMTNGRIEVPVGSGVLKVCIGHKFEEDEFGRRWEVPIYHEYRT